MLITGESGAGKSMFLAHLAGMAAASGFQVFRLDGESPTGAGGYRALAAAVAQWAEERPDAATATLALQVGSGAVTTLRPEDRRLSSSTPCASSSRSRQPPRRCCWRSTTSTSSTTTPPMPGCS